jgi:hypothetical protein
VTSAPLFPAVEGEVIGLPGAAVPGLDAVYVATELGWLGPDGDVVFEAVIRWNATQKLGCGILRLGPDGNVNTVLMQDQALPATSSGIVKHPWLPLEAAGDTLVLPALIDGSPITQGLFAVPKSGGEPVLLAGLHGADGDARVFADGERLGFIRAMVLDDGTVLVERNAVDGRRLLAIALDGTATTIATGFAAGFTTDGCCAAVRSGDRAVAVEPDGTATTLVAPGDPAPGTPSGTIARVRDVYVNDDGAFVVHADTDDVARPDVLLRLHAGGVELLAACGAPAPGTGGTFARLAPARGRSGDVVFTATIDGDLQRPAAVYGARPGEPARLLAATGDAVPGLEADLFVALGGAIAGDGARAAFKASLGIDGVKAGEGIFVGDGSTITRILTTDAPVAGLANTSVRGFLHDPRIGTSVRDDGRTLVHVGLREDRRPDATLGALLLVR